MKKMTTVALSIALALGLAGCSTAANSNSNAEPTAAVTTATASLSSGITLGNMDASVAPQQDFFRHVNGSWLDNTEIPADKARWGSFDELRENAEKQVLAIVQQLAAEHQGSAFRPNLGEFALLLEIDDIEQLAQLANNTFRSTELQRAHAALQAQLKPISDAHVARQAADAGPAHRHLARHPGRARGGRQLRQHRTRQGPAPAWNRTLIV